MEVDAQNVISRAQARIGELEIEVFTLQAALEAQTDELAEARGALEAIASYEKPAPGPEFQPPPLPGGVV